MRDIAANHSRRITDQSRCPRTATVATAERAAIEDPDDGLGVGLGSGLGVGLGLGLGVGLGVGLGSGTPGNNGWGTPGNGDSLSSAGPSSAPKDAGTEHAARSTTINTLEFIILS